MNSSIPTKIATGPSRWDRIRGRQRQRPATGDHINRLEREKFIDPDCVYPEDITDSIDREVFYRGWQARAGGANDKPDPDEREMFYRGWSECIRKAVMRDIAEHPRRKNRRKLDQVVVKISYDRERFDFDI